MTRSGPPISALLLPALLGGLILCALAAAWISLSRAPGPATGTLVLTPAAFADLDGWTADTSADLLPAWRRSCARLTALPPDTPLHADLPHAGHAGDWRALCASIEGLGPNDHGAVRALIEASLVPVTVADGADPTGLFTGYYEPELAGCRAPRPGCAAPIRALPQDLVQVDLGRFRDHLKGERIAGRVTDGRLEPYEPRNAIEAAGDIAYGPPLAYVKDKVDKFFLHIQGSGRIRFDDGGVMRVGYAGQNGHPYTAIGRVLLDWGALDRKTISMQSIRAWLADHPDRADTVMNANASYIFFRPLTIEDPNAGPIGAEGVPLTPGRSLAVDHRFHAYGLPVWVETTAPAGDDPQAERKVHRLMMAQDTGGAIRGPVRGDVFWGFGDAAGEVAGAMKHEGRLSVLVPRAAAIRAGLLPGEG